MKLAILHLPITEAYICGPFAYPDDALWRSQSHTGPEYHYWDLKYKKFRAPLMKKKARKGKP